MSLAADTHKLTPSGLIDLYTLDLNSIGIGQVWYFYPFLNADSHAISYLGNDYLPWPMQITGLEKRGTGSSARPVCEIGNLNRFVTDLCLTYQDLVGATVRRRRTLAHYLQNNIAEYVDEFYLIEQRSSETLEKVSFTLASPIDFLDKQLPGVIAIANSCPHRYRSTDNGSGCSWPGTDSAKWFDSLGNVVTSQSLDVCGKRISDCKARFGSASPLDYGGNPGLGKSS